MGRQLDVNASTSARDASGRERLMASMPSFAGRVRELRELREAVSDSQALVFVEGEAGIGKTRLVRELLAGGGIDDMVLAACPPLRHPQTLGPLVDAVRRTKDLGALGLSALAGALRPFATGVGGRAAATASTRGGRGGGQAPAVPRAGGAA